MGKVAYLDTVMRLDSKDLETNMANANKYYEDHRKRAKASKAANDSLFSSFRNGTGAIRNLDVVMGGLSGEMLGAASATTVLAVGIGAVAAAGAAAVGIIHSVSIATAELGRELDAQAVAANLTRQDIQAVGYATEAYGISTEKAADILKDFQDKLGDFRSTGGGAFADFFEQVGNKVGLTADKLAAMAGPQALIAVKKAMDDANVSADRQVFYMEALAGDAARLIPLLAENGKQFKAMTDRYREMNVELSDSELEKFKQYEQDIKDLELAWDKLSRNAVAPFVGYLGEAARFMFEFINTSKTEQLNDLTGDIESLNEQIKSLESGGSAAILERVGRGVKDSLSWGGGVTGLAVATVNGSGTNEQLAAKLKAELQDKLNEKKEIEESLNRKTADGLTGQTGTLNTIVDLEQKRLDLMKEQAKESKARSAKPDSLYNKLFAKKETEPKNYKRNFDFESSAKSAARLIEGGFIDGAKQFLAAAEGSYSVNKGAGDLYDIQGMKDVINRLREAAGLDYKDIDNPERKVSKKTGDGSSYAKVEFSDTHAKFFEATAKNTEEMAKLIGEKFGNKNQDDALKAANDQQRPSKKFVLELKKTGSDKGISIIAETKEDFETQMANVLESAASGL